MKNSQEYTVLKDHSGFKKGSVRKCHPNLAAMLAKSGKLSPDPIDGKKEKVSDTPKKEEKPKADVITTKAKAVVTPEVEKAKPDKEKSKPGKAK